MQCADNVGVPALESCSDIINFMPAGIQDEQFGHRGREGPIVELPDTFFSGLSKAFEFLPQDG